MGGYPTGSGVPVLHPKSLRPPPPHHHRGVTGGGKFEDEGVNEGILLSWISKELGWSVEFIPAAQNSEMRWVC